MTLTNEQETFKAKAAAAGYPWALVQDFWAALSSDPVYAAWATNPTLENLREYKADMDSAYNSQAKWDGSCRQDPIFPKP